SRADAALADQEKRRGQVDVRAVKDEQCREAARAFCRATDALWLAEHSGGFNPEPFLRSIHNCLWNACEALSQAGRFGDWGKTDHDETYAASRYVNQREMTRVSYEWAQELFKAACDGKLSEIELVNTWRKKSLRDALRWLRIFLCGL